MLLRRGVLPQGVDHPICFAHTCCLTDLITGRNTHIMRARFVRSRGRATTRGRYFVPLSATAVVALAAGTLVAVNPISDGDNVALTQSTASSFEAGAGADGAADTNGTVGQAVSIPLQSLFDVSGQYSWILEASEISVTGLPEGLNFNEETKTIEGIPTKSGSFTIVVTAGDQTAEADISIGTEGDGTVATGSLGSDNPLSGAVTAVLGSLGLSGEAAANSTGNAGGEVPGNENPDTTGSLIDVEGNGNTEGTTGSLPIDVQALIEGATGSTGDVETPETPTEGEIDGEGNINLVSIGDPEHPAARFPGSFGSSYLYFVVPKVILFRTEHSKRTLVPKVSYISAPGGSDDNVYRNGGPVALITNRCLFSFDQDRRRFRLESVHPGHTLAEVIVNTGFEFDRPPEVPVTPAPSAETLRLMRQVVAPELAEVYPQFAARVFGVTAAP